MSLRLLLLLGAATCVTCAAPLTRNEPMAPEPNLRYRIDCFVVPEGSRVEFETAMRRNMSFIATLPGFRGHTVFERADGPSTFNLITVATWESPAALEHAVREVRAYYGRIGFDPPATMKRLGVRSELGLYSAPARLQP